MGSGISEEKARSVQPQRLRGHSTASPAPKTMFFLLFSTGSSRARKEMAKWECLFHWFLSTHGRRIPHAAVANVASGAASPVGRISRAWKQEAPRLARAPDYFRHKISEKHRPRGEAIQSPQPRAQGPPPQTPVSPSTASSPPAPRKPAGSTLRLYQECRHPRHHLHCYHLVQGPLGWDLLAFFHTRP